MVSHGLGQDVIDHGPHDSNGSGISAFQNNQTSRWFKNKRTKLQNVLETIKLERGGTLAVEWGRAARFPGAPPVNATVLTSVTGEGGTTNFDYADAMFGEGEFLGWGRIATRRPSGSVRVDTFATSVPLANRPWTSEEYDAQGRLASIHVHVYRGLAGTGAHPLDWFAPYDNVLVRTCHFTTPDGSAPKRSSRTAFVLACEEFDDEGPGTPLGVYTANPSSILLDASGNTNDYRLFPPGTVPWQEIPISNPVGVLLSYGAWPETAIVDLGSLSGTARERLRDFSHAVRGLLYLPNQTLQGATHYDQLGNQASQFRSNLVQVSATHTSQDLMDFGLTEIFSPPAFPSPPSPEEVSGFRMTVSETDWFDVLRPAQVRRLNDVTTQGDSVITNYGWFGAVEGFEWPVPSYISVADVGGADVRTASFSAAHYDHGRWTQVSIESTLDSPGPDGGSLGPKTYVRAFTPRGQVHHEIPPGLVSPTTFAVGPCGVDSVTQGPRVTTVSFDDQCRSYEAEDFDGLVVSSTFDDFRRVRVQSTSAFVPPGMTHQIFEDTTSFYDDSASSTPARVDLVPDGNGVYGMTKTFVDVWGRTTAEEICEWVRPPGCIGAPSSCALQPWRLGDFDCDPNGAVHIVRTDTYDGLGRIGSYTEWHEPGSASPPTTTTLYDEFDRPVQKTLPNGVVELTTWDLGSTTVQRVGGLSMRDTHNSLARGVDWWDSASATWRPQSHVVTDHAGRVVQETNAAGLVTHLEYDGYGRLEARYSGEAYYDECGPLAQSIEGDARTAYFHDIADRLVVERDPSGSQTEFDYDEMSRVVEIRRRHRDSNGNDLGHETLETVSYVDLPYPDRMVARSDGMGNFTYTSLLAWGDPWEIVYPDGTRQEYSYDQRRRVAETFRPFDGDGTYVRFQYDVLDRLISRSTELGSPGHAQFQSLGQTTYDYTALGQVRTTIDPDGVTIRNDYDAAGRWIGQTLGSDPATNKTLFERKYDSLGRAYEETRDGVVTRFEYDSFERMSSKRTAYDAVANDALSTELYGYDAGSRLDSIEYGDGSRTGLIYDGHGRVIQSSLYHPLGGKLTDRFYGYDIRGNLVQEIDEIGLITCTEFDYVGRVASAAAPGTAATTYTYQRGTSHPVTGLTIASQAITRTLPTGEMSTDYYDGMGRLHIEETPTHVTLRQYDVQGRHTMTQQGEGKGTGFVENRETVYGYETFGGRVTQSSDWVEPEMGIFCVGPNARATCPIGVTERTWSLAGRPLTLVDPNGQQTTWQYAGDGLGLLERVDVQDVTAYVYTYDPQYAIVTQLKEGLTGALTVEHTWERNLRVTNTTRVLSGSPVEETRRTFDVLGRIQSESRWIGGVLQAQREDTFDDYGLLETRTLDIPSLATMQASWVHLANGLTRVVQYPSQSAVRYSYEPGSARVALVETIVGGTVVSDALTVPQGGYDASGRLLSFMIAPGRGSQTTITRTLETGTGRLESRDVILGGEHFAEVVSYDKYGLLAGIDRQPISITQPVDDVQYSHTVRGFVETEERQSSAGGASRGFAYTYDSSGNRLTSTYLENSTPLSTTQIDYPSYPAPPGSTIPVGSDKASGVVQNGVTQPIAWDSLGRQTTSSDGRQLTYNLNHELVQQDNGALQTSLIGPGGREWMRTDASGTTYFFPGADGQVIERVLPNGSRVDSLFLGANRFAELDSAGQLRSVLKGVDGQAVAIDEQQRITREHLNAWGVPSDGTPPVAVDLDFHDMQPTATPSVNRAGVRAYDVTVGRFTSPDPLGFAGGGPDLFRYANNSPATLHDRSGLSPQILGVPRVANWAANPTFIRPPALHPMALAFGIKKAIQRHNRALALAAEAVRSFPTCGVFGCEPPSVHRRSGTLRKGLPPWSLPDEPGAPGGESPSSEDHDIPPLPKRDGHDLPGGAGGPSPLASGGDGPRDNSNSGTSRAGDLQDALIHSVIDGGGPVTAEANGSGTLAMPNDMIDMVLALNEQTAQTTPGNQASAFPMFNLLFFNHIVEGISKPANAPGPGDMVYPATGWEEINTILLVGPMRFGGGINRLRPLAPRRLPVSRNPRPAGPTALNRRARRPRFADRSGSCFVSGTEVLVPTGSVSIEEISSVSVVLAAASTDGGEEPWAEVADAPVDENGAWTPRGVCDRVTAWAPKWAMPAMVALWRRVAPSQSFRRPTRSCRSTTRGPGTGPRHLEPSSRSGDTWLDEGRLHRWTDDGVEDRGAATVEDLAAKPMRRGRRRRRLGCQDTDAVGAGAP